MTVDVTGITVAQFKTQFFRGFPYLPLYDNSAVYNTDEEVYYEAGGLFYKALADGVTGITPGTDATKWVKVTDSLENWVMDADIENAFVEAQSLFNIALYGTDAAATLAYMYLTAHWLAHDLKTALAGLTASGSFPVSSKSAGSVSESYSIPAQYVESPIISQYTSTAYGMKFLALTLPALVGNVGYVAGATVP